jgi:hypothetical protein
MPRPIQDLHGNGGIAWSTENPNFVQLFFPGKTGPWHQLCDQMLVLLVVGGLVFFGKIYIPIACSRISSKALMPIPGLNPGDGKQKSRSKEGPGGSCQYYSRGKQWIMRQKFFHAMTFAAAVQYKRLVLVADVGQM